MNKDEVKQLLYNRYIRPTVNNRNKFIGVEIEMPILNLNKQPVDFNIIHNVTKEFINNFGFNASGIDDEGNIYSAESPENGDILSYDCSYNNLELSFGVEKNLFDIQARFNKYYSFLQAELCKYNYTLTGMGINPYRNYNNNVPIPNGRYRMLFHHLHSYKKYTDVPMFFHSYPEYGTFSSASQVQLDVEYNQLPLVLNVFSKLEPIKAVLFSNSVLLNEHEDILCYRDLFWENSTHGINSHNIGMYNREFKNTDEILSYITTTSIYCVERGEKYINFKPILITDYLNAEEVTGEYYENGKYKEITFSPNADDIKYLRTFKFEDITYRGTVEFRSVCCQPIKDSMTVSAFHIGIKENLYKVNDLLLQDTVLYGNGYTAGELRKLLIKKQQPGFINRDALYNLIKNVVDLAREGLIGRGYGEEALLNPLYERINKRTNPAKTMLKLMQQGVAMEEVIKLFS